MNLALFGGSFDPPHAGHDAIVREILRQNFADLLVIMPTFINPFKYDFSAPPNLRLKWCEALWGELKNVIISDYEISQNRKVGTIESVKFLIQKFNADKIYLIIGADNLAELEKWQNFSELKNLVCFVIATREGAQIPIKWQNLPKLNINVKISSSFFRQNLAGEIPAPIKGEVMNFYKGIKMQEIKQRAEKIAHLLSEKKAENPQIIDMSDKEYIAKFVVIATTLTGRHAYSLINEMKTVLKPAGEEFLAIEEGDDWSVVDLGDIIVHLMSETYRAKYDIEDFLAKLKKEEF